MGTLVLDLDGTLYSFRGGSFDKSRIKEKVLENASLFIQEKLNKSASESQKLLLEIIKQDGEHLSLALERDYQLPRQLYFNQVWDIQADLYIKYNPNLSVVLKKLALEFNLVLVSDAPLVWVNHVLETLKVKSFFKGQIFSGESDFRKSFNNAFGQILRKLNLSAFDCVSIGDQEKTDIIPAQAEGLKTVLVSPEPRSQTVADFQISKIEDLLLIIDQIRLLKIKKLPSSPESQVILKNNYIYKTASTIAIEEEITSYGRLSKYLPGLPEVKLHSSFGDRSTLKKDYLEGQTFEEMIFDFSKGKFSLAELDQVNHQVLNSSLDLFEKTKSLDLIFDEADFKRFLADLITVCQRLSLPDIVKVLRGYSKLDQLFLDNLKGSLAHNDLTVGNIFINQKKVFLIDPRLRLAQTSNPKVVGQISFDLIGYHVSLWRKSLEVQRQGSNLSLQSLIDPVVVQLAQLKLESFNSFFENLIYFYWFLIYYSCPCDYCLTDQNKWLRLEMGKLMVVYLNKLQVISILN